jgi:hypothetical protein
VKTPRADLERSHAADFHRFTTSSFNMTPHHDPVLFRQLPVIRKIIDDEMWLEGERRGRPVSEDDTVVRERVCEIVLRVGRELRESLERAAPAGRAETTSPVPTISLGAEGHVAA